ncbi:MAG: hypothetical protein QM719_04680 [Thermomonas sp.]
MKISLFDSGFSDRLSRVGLVELDPYADPSCARDALVELANAFESSKRHIDVDADGITMRTLNGAALLGLCPSVGHIYQYTLQSLRREMPDLHEISVKPIAVSANYLRGGNDKFRMHFDRHQLTAIVYLNDAPSMPLIAYPNVRRDPLMAGGKEPFDISTADRYVIEPRTNTGLVFFGSRTYHGIENRVAQESDHANRVERYSLQFGFDFTPCDYEGQSYYGMTQGNPGDPHG